MRKRPRRLRGGARQVQGKGLRTLGPGSREGISVRTQFEFIALSRDRHFYVGALLSDRAGGVGLFALVVDEVYEGREALVVRLRDLDYYPEVLQRALPGSRYILRKVCRPATLQERSSIALVFSCAIS